MATTQEAERADITATLADEYLADLVYRGLLERGEPAKASEITLEIGNPRITFPLVRRTLSDSPRFLSVDRQWDLSARYLDRARPTERNLQEVLEAAGHPLSNAHIATELSAIYRRPADVYLSLLARVDKNPDTYLRTRTGDVALTSWLPLVDAEDEEDVLFDNELTPGELAPFLDASKKVDWSSYAGATRQIVAALEGRPVPHRLLGVLAWYKLREGYDPAAHLRECFEDAELVWLSGPSGGRWITRARADALETVLAERAEEMGAEDVEEIAQAAVVVPEPEPVPEGAEVALIEETADVVAPVVPEIVHNPLDVTEEDRAALEQIVVERGAAVDAVELLALQYEVVPGDPSFREDLATLEAALRGDERFQYVGAGRFREPNSLPLFVYTTPESLSYPDLQFVSLEGEIMDEEIEEEGFVGTLRQEIQNPLVQDVGDDEGHYTGEAGASDESLRLVLKAHHKEIGTFPLCQIPDGFLPADADVVEISIRDPEGQTHDVIVNNDLRMAFNLFGLYEMVPADSGGVFHLEKTARPYEFRFVPGGEGDENDPDVYLTPARFGELLALREQAEESGDMATFDILCEVLAHHPKGLSFVAAMTEVNVVRRVTRRKLASILSNYYCFVQKAGQGLWRFDAKKRDMGTDRTKRKYLKR